MFLLEKIKTTISLLQPAIIGIVAVWCEVDIAFYTTATTSLLVSICDYVEIFLKKK